jgi:hypothetical protein
MEENQTVQEQHVCGLCQGVFNSVEEYTGHTCPSTGFTPADPAHQGPEFAAVQQAALARGAEAQAEPEAPAAYTVPVPDVPQE